MNRATALLLCAAAGSAGCSVRTDHVVRLASVRNGIPVSLTGHYVDLRGNTVAPDQYAVVGKLRVERTLPGSVDGKTEAEVSLDADVASAAEQHRGRAVVNVVTYAERYSAGHTLSKPLRLSLGTGWLVGGLALGGGGGALLAAGVRDAEAGASIMLGGAALLGTLGVILLATSGAGPSSEWKVVVEGDVVRPLDRN